MPDIDVVRRFRSEVPEPDMVRLSPIRGRLTTPHTGARSRRMLLRAGLAGAMAVAISLGFGIVRGGDTVGTEPSGPAAVFLNAAAAAAEKVDVDKPQPHQFVTVGSVDAEGNTQRRWIRFDNGVQVNRENGETVYRATIPYERDRAIAGQYGSRPADRYDELRELPTDPEELLAKAYEDWDGHILWRMTEAEHDRGALIQLTTYLDPAPLVPSDLRAAAYRAMARIPGVEKVDKVEDALGRTGIGIALDTKYAREIVIFDPETYEILGGKSIALRTYREDDADRTLIRRGTVLSLAANTEYGIVDEVGEMP